ncbi:MAG: 4-(cytidine 5'-diphospho)-2-C-methyl-D-erythritol kinase [Armatimonadetes bacterium]|nr:4-(cytidine 5'-diphospho)-2-C-methyl-D-erythritol kinase [Armatimonadota bacterium]
MRSFRLAAHAKINTFLAVGPRRDDGHHDLRTVYQAISLCDDVEFRPSDRLEICCSQPGLSGEANLAWKALRLLAETVEPPHVRIHIQKRIPLQAGLGGGSSDAAAVLYGANRLLDNVCAERDLLTIAAACGADVPFFLLRTARARGTGRGDRVEAIPAPSSRPIVIAKPATGVRTGDAYAGLDVLPERPFLDFPDDESAAHNDFDAVAPLESARLIERLGALGAECAQLCGSGSAVFGLFSQDAQAGLAAETLKLECAWTHVGHTLTRMEGPEWTP